MEYIQDVKYNEAVLEAATNPEFDQSMHTMVPADALVSEGYDESYNGGEFRETRTVLASSDNAFGVSSIKFDTIEEVVWSGNQRGQVTSHYGSCLEKYSSFSVHSNHEVRQIETFNDGVLALTQNNLRFQHRRGFPLYTHTSDNMMDLQCLLCMSDTRIIIGGLQNQIIDYDLSSGKEKQLVDVDENGCAILRQHSRLICAGSPFGKIYFKDPKTLSTEHCIDTHSGSLSDFEVQGNYLVTCGFSNRRQGLSVDRFLMVYDLRQMKALSPLPTVIYPLLLKFLPSYSTRIAVISPLGQMQLLDTIYANAQSSMTYLYQVATEGAMVLSVDVSPTSQCFCFGDSLGTLHLMSTNVSEPQFNTFSRSTEFMDPNDILQCISIEDESVPLSVLPIMHTSNLLSDWPENLTKLNYRQTPEIDAEILQSMKVQGNIGYARNPRPQNRGKFIK